MATARIQTAGDFLAEIEYHLKNTESIFPKQTELFAYLNQAYEILWNDILIQDRSDLIRSSDNTIDTVDGTETYALSGASAAADDIVSIHEIFLEDSAGEYFAPLDLVDETDRYSYILGNATARAAAESRPTMFYFTGASLGLLPVPDAVYTVHFTGYPNWTPLASLATNMPIRNIFNPALREAVLFVAKNRDLQPSQMHYELQRIMSMMGHRVLSQRRPKFKRVKVRT